MKKRTIGRALAPVVSVALAALMVPTAAQARFGDDTLSVGDRGRDVKTAQKYLTRAGIRTRADGVYGRATARKVKRFEREEDRRVNGRLSPSDARALKRAVRRGGTRGGNGGAMAGEMDEHNGGEKAVLSDDGKTAIAPAGAPQEVKDAIDAANEITDKPYRYGGGHGRFKDSGYDCSGAVSYALHGAGLLDRPLDSTGFMRWEEAGKGEWITVYANSGHAYVIIAGLRFDTSGKGEKGPRWRPEKRSSRGFKARHPEGL